MRSATSLRVILPVLLALITPHHLPAQAAPNLFRDDTLGTLNPNQAQKDAHFPMTTIEQGAFTCGARFTNDIDLLNPRPIIFYDLCNVNNSTRVTKAVDHLVIDCTPGPGLQLTGRPQLYSRLSEPEFTFATGGRSALCSLDGGAFAACASPYRPTALADGPHRLMIRAVESDGQTGSALQFDWTLDRQAPAAPSVFLPELKSGDLRAVELQGDGEPGAQVGIIVSAGRNRATMQVRVDEAGHYRALLDLSSFSEEMLAAVVTQIDAAGNVSREGAAAALKSSPAAARSPVPARAAASLALSGKPPQWLSGAGMAPPALPSPGAAPDSPAEAAACLSLDPSVWPASSRPYFMVIADTSGSMTSAVAGAPSCGFPSTRNGHLRCALSNLLKAYSGEVNFGLMSYARRQTGCSAACFTSCVYSDYPLNATLPGCGPGIGTARRGGFIQSPMLQDHFWVNPPDANNTPALLSWGDNNCTSNIELFADGNTPLNGALRDTLRYFSPAGWVAQDSSVTYPTPLAAQDLSGGGVNGSTACRSVNIILITDGDETCDTQADAEAAATALYSTGVTVGGKTFKIRTFVINFAGGSVANSDAIALAGGTTVSYFATNETQLAQALGNIVAGAIPPERGDNLDNNCNGCTDEGYAHYANIQPIASNCCAWATPAQRTTCLNNFRASITPANPQGNLNLLPCTSAAQAIDPLYWLLYNPGERCDNVDNNGVNGVDEGLLKCGSPLHCPSAEVCNGQDDNCDGIVDNGCPGIVGAEVCNGCDDDFNGIADDGIASAPCGIASPANCLGSRSCKPPQPVTPGGCVAGGGWNACGNSPQAETCGDGFDNNCNGALDDGSNCPYAGRTEVCNGVDDNCNGLIDEGVTPPPDAKFNLCGVSPVATAPECTSAVTVSCVGGAWQCGFPAGVCTAGGGCAATAEICDTLDNNCDGRSNENVADYGQPCASDDTNPVPGDGVCRTFGTKVCNGANATICSAVKADCATLPGGCTELCDGVDNDCDGLTDESFSAKGANAANFVKPVVTKAAASLWIFSYEASRSNATTQVPGSGNGYVTSAPVGSTLDKTPACSVPGKIPWFNVTPIEAEQTCIARGGHVCSTAEWQTACSTNPPSGTNCTWGYNPRGTACTSVFLPNPPNNPGKFCNLGLSYDFNSGAAGDQDGLLVAGSPLLSACWADWSGLQSNTATTNKIYDLTGNLREITKSGVNIYPVMGGALASASDAGATCGFTFYTVDQNFQLYDAGFRCCFTVDPTL